MSLFSGMSADKSADASADALAIIIHSNSHAPLEIKEEFEFKGGLGYPRGIRFPEPHGFFNGTPYLQLMKTC